MRFLHTADWQIGMKALHAGASASKVREQRLISAAKVMHVAQQQHVDFIVLAGDTFEHNGVDRVLVQKVADLLRTVNCPVFVLPGNHDPFEPGSVWHHPAWKNTGNVVLLTEPQPRTINNVVIYPAPIYEKRSPIDPTQWWKSVQLSGEANKMFHIGIAHGTVDGIVVDDPYFPISRTWVEHPWFDYVALGHWHSTTLFHEPSADVVRMAYSGTHEPTRFSERDSGNVLLVDIYAHKQRPVVTVIPTKTLAWTELNVSVQSSADLEKTRTEIEQVLDPQNTLMSLKLTGRLGAKEHDALVRLGEILEARFLLGRLDMSELVPIPDELQFPQISRSTILRMATERLKQWADPTVPVTRPAGVTPEIASWALLELYELAHQEKDA